MLASAPEGRPRTRPPTTLGAIHTDRHAQVPDLTFDCNIRARPAPETAIPVVEFATDRLQALVPLERARPQALVAEWRADAA